MKKAIMILAVFCSLAVTGSAQKFALIDMEYILKSIPAYEMANEQLKQVDPLATGNRDKSQGG